jgi:DNA-binding GntR family transcriptional regulator
MGRHVRAAYANGSAERVTAAARSGNALISFRRNTIGAQIHAVLRNDIVGGRLAPRVMLSEQEIAAGFGVSRTPVREAMIKLAEEGLVEIFPQYGSFVAPIKLRDVFASQFAREALECAAVDRAAERMDKLQDARLEAEIARQHSLLEPEHRDAFFRADEDLHILILTIAGQATAWQFVESAKMQMDRVRHIAMTMPRKQVSIVAEHEAVVDRLLARDRRGAVEAMRAHLRGIFRTVARLKDEKGDYFVDDEEQASPARPRSGSSRQARNSKSQYQPNEQGEHP